MAFIACTHQEAGRQAKKIAEQKPVAGDHLGRFGARMQPESIQSCIHVMTCMHRDQDNLRASFFFCCGQQKNSWYGRGLKVAAEQQLHRDCTKPLFACRARVTIQLCWRLLPRRRWAKCHFCSRTCMGWLPRAATGTPTTMPLALGWFDTTCTGTIMSKQDCCFECDITLHCGRSTGKVEAGPELEWQMRQGDDKIARENLASGLRGMRPSLSGGRMTPSLDILDMLGSWQCHLTMAGAHPSGPGGVGKVARMCYG